MKKNISFKNKKARFEYIFLDEYVAGIKLVGTEIKSIRAGKVSFSDSFCYFRDGELFLKNFSISEYEKASFEQHEPKRDRKLLLTKRELRKLESSSRNDGLTIIPYIVFINERGLAKVTIVLAKGKKLFDKRNDIKKRDDERSMRSCDD